ncbi:E3 ubiquitin/ISG15 ligase TRIM25-like [Channa argus]|uniref:E3 ubiquitin/ISG15 ligase TRIM25-like n=1 Tax=Channa argus TaxID=215402 RepID=UPI002944B865|nr:hypothetical protein Q8A73_014342 [Channa argus]
MALSMLEDQLANELTCPICLQFYSDPVVLPCGHNYCRVCICKTAAITNESAKILPRCPECREEFQGVQTLQKNFKLCSIIEGYKAAAPQLDWQPEAKPRTTAILCDHCIDEQTQAVKTCLKCEVSLCSRHLQKHHEKELFKGHTMVEPMDILGVKACHIHMCPLEYFCSNDMTSLCTSCISEGHHQNHDVLTLSVAEEEMKRGLESRIKVVSGKLQMTESLLQKASEEQAASEAIGDKLLGKAVIVVDSMAALMDGYKERLHVLQDEEKNQRKKIWELELNALRDQQQQLQEVQQSATQVLNETDPCLFMHRFRMIEQKLGDGVTCSIPSLVPSNAPLDIKNLQAGLKTQDFYSEMTRLLHSLHILLNPLDLSFNLCTAHPSLILSNDLRTVKYSLTKQPYPEHPERFTTTPQVLCSQSFSSGEHIWVVEVGPNSMWSVGVCYKSIPRRGDHSRLGRNSVSWRLQWKNGKLTACQSSCNVSLGEKNTTLLKIEMRLNYEAGTLTFHSATGQKERLHTFRTVFQEPIYPAFSIHSNTPESWITLHSVM